MAAACAQRVGAVALGGTRRIRNKGEHLLPCKEMDAHDSLDSSLAQAPQAGQQDPRKAFRFLRALIYVGLAGWTVFGIGGLATMIEEIFSPEKNGWLFLITSIFQGPVGAIGIAALVLERKGVFEPSRVKAKHTATLAATLLILQVTTWLLLLATRFSGNLRYDF